MFFFPRSDDALETFSLDALLLSTTVEKSPVVVLERYATHPDQPVSKPKAIVYDDWYARAKEALTTNDFSSNLSTKTKKKNKKYAFTLEEKKKKKKKEDDDAAPFELVWRFSTTTNNNNNNNNNNNGKTREEKGDDDGKMLMMRGSCKMKRVGAATAEDAEVRARVVEIFVHAIHSRKREKHRFRTRERVFA